MNYRWAIIALALALTLSPIARAADAENLRTINTSGTATIYVVPDEAVIRFEVHNFNEDLKKARALNDDAAAKMLKVVKDCGVADKDIQTDRASTEPQYEQTNPAYSMPRLDQRRKIIGYETSKAYVVTLRNLENFQPLVDTILSSADCTLQNFTFQTSELRKHRDEARKMAIHAAKDKAIALAAELESKVGRPRTINESEETFSPYNNMQMQQVAFRGAGGADDANTPLGQIPVRATVNVTFDLE